MEASEFNYIGEDWKLIFGSYIYIYMKQAYMAYKLRINYSWSLLNKDYNFYPQSIL